jgi:3-hydroxyisobutyrate dehydrogenase-like beta-hydroxyacid dehydrogenase
MITPSVGFIGLGIMGKPMARNLLQAGNSLPAREHVWPCQYRKLLDFDLGA